MALGMERLTLKGLRDRASRGAPLLGTQKHMLIKALEMGVCFHWGPAFGEHGGAPFSYSL